MDNNANTKIEVDREFVAQEVAKILSSEVRPMVRVALQEQATEMISAAMKDDIRNTLDSIVRELATPRIEKMLADGWQPVDRYGNKSGEKINLATFIQAMLSGPVRYGERDNTLLESLIKKRIDETVQVQTDAALREAASDIGKRLRARTAERFADYLMQELAR